MFYIFFTVPVVVFNTLEGSEARNKAKTRYINQKSGKFSALKHPKTLFFGPKSPPQAKKNWGFSGQKSISHYTPFVIGRFETRGRYSG